MTTEQLIAALEEYDHETAKLAMDLTIECVSKLTSGNPNPDPLSTADVRRSVSYVFTAPLLELLKGQQVNKDIAVARVAHICEGYRVLLIQDAMVAERN